MTTPIEVLVELRDIKQRVSVLIALLADDVAQDVAEDEARKERMWRRVAQAIQENVEARPSMGATLPRFDEPSHIAIPCASSGTPPLPAHGCWEPNDDPDIPDA